MKQIEKTERILQLLRRSLGSGVNLDSLRVFEAIALNTLPLRKRTPLYRGARAERSLLLEMAAHLEHESVPVRIEHNTNDQPLGRVFYGEVLDNGPESELRVLFFLDPTADKEAVKIDSGSIDQVSIAVLPKHIYSSASGFDFLGPDATFQNIMEGTDPDGNVLGENGVFARLVGLDQWFEMSLVGQGGAQNARIVSRDQSHFGSSYENLAASGVDPNAFILVASTSVRNEKKMDLETLVAQLTDAKTELALNTSKIADLEASITTLTAQNEELKAQVESAITTEAHEEVKAELSAAVQALQDVAKKVLTAAGKVADNIPETVAELNTLISETTSTLASVLIAGGRSQDATESPDNVELTNIASAFRVRS